MNGVWTLESKRKYNLSILNPRCNTSSVSLEARWSGVIYDYNHSLMMFRPTAFFGIQWPKKLKWRKCWTYMSSPFCQKRRTNKILMTTVVKNLIALYCEFLRKLGVRSHIQDITLMETYIGIKKHKNESRITAILLIWTNN